MPESEFNAREKKGEWNVRDGEDIEGARQEDAVEEKNKEAVKMKRWGKATERVQNRGMQIKNSEEKKRESETGEVEG